MNDPNPKNLISPNLSFLAKNSAAYFLVAFKKPKSAYLSIYNEIHRIYTKNFRFL